MRILCWLCVATALWQISTVPLAAQDAADQPPNIVLIFADDLGYGDLGCYGQKKWRTPHLDRISAEGVRFTDFYVAQPVCSASRAALLTGCYPNRIGIHGALGPLAKGGLQSSEETLATLLKRRGYASACVGKWHLGDRSHFLPLRHGFDEFLGLPYSNDMWPHHPEARPGTYPPLPLLSGDQVADGNVTPETQAMLTARFTEQAVAFIEAKAAQPFFLYLAFPMPHVPLFVHPKNQGRSGAGLYGDVIEELDESVGAIVAALARTKVTEKTIVIFTSDNGPWLSYGNHAGTAGHLREGKGTVWEGGVRVPFVASWPGKIPAGAVQSQPAMTIDLLPTLVRFAQAEMPRNPIDGRDIGDLLCCVPDASSPHEAYWFYYGRGELQAIRSGPWKLILPHRYRTMKGQALGRDGTPGKYRMEAANLELYHLGDDPGETKNLVTQEPGVLRRLQNHAESARRELGDRLTQRTGVGVRTP